MIAGGNNFVTLGCLLSLVMQWNRVHCYFACTACYQAIRTKFLFLFLRRQNHDHLTAFHLWPLFDLAIRFQILFQTFQHSYADILMRHLTTAETQCDFGFIAVFQEFNQVAQLDVVITIIGTCLLYTSDAADE